MTTLEDHFADPDITIDQHVDARALNLANQLVGKAAIYLDTRFWIVVREVRDGTRTKPIERKLVHHLEALVGAGRAFCPIAEPTFSELMKQGDEEQRVATAQVVDDLSCGASILPDIDRMPAEARNLLLSKLTRQEQAPYRPWTGVGFVLGNMFPVETAFGPVEERAIQKTVYDRLWETPLAQLVTMLDSRAFSEAEEGEQFASHLNAENLRHRPQMQSFDWVLEQEFDGVARTSAEMLPELAAMLAPFRSAMPFEPVQLWRNSLREMLKNPEHARRLPAANVHATIHALFRWEYRDKTITPNDLVDFRHAAAALGYCDALLTEAGLRRTLDHRRRSLRELHGKIVLNDLDDILDYLQSLRRR